MAFTAGVKDFYKWWRWEAASLIGASQPPAGPSTDAVLEIHRDGIVVRSAGPAESTVSERAADAGEAAELVRDLAGKSRRSRLHVELVIGADRALCRHLAPLRLPKSRWKSMAVIDCAAATPIDPSECYILLPDYTNHDPKSLYFVVRKSVLDSLLAEFRQARVAITKIAMMEGGQRHYASAESFREVLPAAIAKTLGRRVNVLLAVGFVALCGAFFLTTYRNQSGALDELDARIEAAQMEAAIIRAAITSRNERFAQLAAAHAEKTGTVPFIRIMEEMARAIPDHTYLEELNFNNKTVTFSGISEAAAILVPTLEALPLFSAPSFTRPVVRSVERKGERFTISMSIEAPHG